jgi:coenzyme PQQ precursor peptide PqqA
LSDALVASDSPAPQINRISNFLGCDLRMAGMRPFALSGEIASVQCESLAATGCPSSQIATDKPTAVPLWKVIVGPAPTNYYRTRKGPVFLWRDRRRDGSGSRAWAPARGGIAVLGRDDHAFARTLARRSKPHYPHCTFFTRRRLDRRRMSRERPMAWTTPTLVEICIGLEINGYLPAEF